jgi:hypothetical protein
MLQPRAIALVLFSFLVVSPLSAQPAGWTAWFTDNFSDGTYQRWQVGTSDETGAHWAVENDGGNNVFAGYGHISAGVIPVQGGDYRVRARVKLISGGLQIVIRDRNCLRYYIGFNTSSVYLGKTSPCGAQTILNNVSETHSTGVWYDLEVIAAGANIKVKVDGAQKIDYTDTSIPVVFGGTYLESMTGAAVKVDDVEVTGPPQGIAV